MNGRCPSHIWIKLKRKRSKLKEYVCGRPGCDTTQIRTDAGNLTVGRPERKP